ncbi:MAG: amidinotransferase [Gammaproteobacteria bacterium]|nr:amidinotransferase [Gammaproteobacteria bacterium]MCP4980406.1 amidinotransferase [Gammaproteobacteria bacterium]
MTSIYNQTIKLFGSQPEPGFEDASQQHSVWGRQWGCDNDVGQIRLCLMHRPGEEMSIIDPARRIEEVGSFGDLEQGWYFQSDVIPDWDEFRAQHEMLVQTLRSEGVEVVFLDSVEPDGIKSVYTRDSSFAINGGAIVTRLARSIRRGEEAHVSKTLANLGMPIMRTLHTTAMAEGGSFAWLNSKTAVIARSICVNDEGCDQIEQVLNAQGVELIRIDMPGYDIHIDGLLTMIDVDVAIVDPDHLPYSFLRRLEEIGIRTVEICEQDDPWIINCLAVSPGRVIMPRGISTQTATAFAELNIETIEIDYDKVQLNGGGIHCSTCPLVRDSVG